MFARLILVDLVFFSVIAPIVTSVFKCIANFLFKSMSSVVLLFNTVMSTPTVLAEFVVVLFTVDSDVLLGVESFSKSLLARSPMLFSGNTISDPCKTAGVPDPKSWNP